MSRWPLGLRSACRDRLHGRWRHRRPGRGRFRARPAGHPGTHNHVLLGRGGRGARACVETRRGGGVGGWVWGGGGGGRDGEGWGPCPPTPPRPGGGFSSVRPASMHLNITRV